MPHRVAPPPLRRVGLLDLLDLVAAQRFDTVRHRLAVSAVAVVEFRGLAVVRRASVNSVARLVSRLIVVLLALAGGSRDIRFRNFRGDHRFLGGAQRDRRRLAVRRPLARPIVPSRVSPAVCEHPLPELPRRLPIPRRHAARPIAGSRFRPRRSRRSVATGSSAGSGAAVTPNRRSAAPAVPSAWILGWRPIRARHRSAGLAGLRAAARAGASSRRERPGGAARGRRPPRKATAPLAVRRPLHRPRIVLGLALRDLHRLRQGRGKRYAGILAAGAIVAGVVVMIVRRLVRSTSPCGRSLTGMR